MVAKPSHGSCQCRSRQCNRRNPDLRQWLPLAHIFTSAVGLPMQDPAAILVTAPGPGWHELPSVRGPGGRQPQRLGLLRWQIPSMWLRQEESVTLKLLSSSQRCRSLTSVHLGCHPPWHIHIFSQHHVYSASWGLKLSAKPITKEGTSKEKRE